ncbi:hypothetical protein [Ligilactobacillus equi]|uniref:Uncharacterized protein n=1 Tax=Ligilactobacillus equi DPC 6820 TaxID=1392007 RepID=V7HXP2_9LACO|nr:hypothetical protein [Ligilactobacillus equi]ETA74060.1 hypothetical protein LEQ_1520c [Ligilactobacillus equi DPC 6820]
MLEDYAAVLIRNGEVMDWQLCDSLEEAEGWDNYWKCHIGEENWDVDSYEAKIFKEIGEEES